MPGRDLVDLLRQHGLPSSAFSADDVMVLADHEKISVMIAWYRKEALESRA